MPRISHHLLSGGTHRHGVGKGAGDAVPSAVDAAAVEGLPLHDALVTRLGADLQVLLEAIPQKVEKYGSSDGKNLGKWWAHLWENGWDNLWKNDLNA